MTLIHAPRRAITLLELLLALSLIVVIAALAGPTIAHSFENRRLRLAAEQFRSDLIETRVKAINTGGVFVVRYVPQQASYTIALYGGHGLEGSSAAGVLIDAGLPGAGAPAADVALRDIAPKQCELPDGITFLGARISVDTREAEILAELASQLQTRQTSNGLPEQMLFCYPDGTTSTALLALGNRDDRALMLQVRGLTGVVKIGEVIMAQELPR